MADSERNIISKVIYSGEMSTVLQAGITRRFFHDPEHAEVWQFMSEHWSRYQKAPSRDTLRMEYPNYTLAKVSEPLEYYIASVIESHRRAETFDIVGDATAAITEDEDVDGALAIMSEGALWLNKQTTRTTDVNVIDDWENRMERWAQIKANPDEFKGIPTGFPFIDQVTGGLQAEQMMVLLGSQKSGKSSIALKIAISACDAGYSSLFLGFEMSNTEQEARHDAMRGGFNPNKLLQGKTTVREEERLAKALKSCKNKPPIHFVHDMGARTLSNAVAKAHQYKPDLVIVDGAYLMDAEIPGVEGMDTRALTKISRSFKLLAQTLKIPVILTTQALDWKWSSKKGLTANAAGYTSAFGQDCDIMIGTEAGETEDDDHKVRIIIGRNVGRAVAHVQFDWDHGRIEEIEEWDGGDDDDDDLDAVA